MCGIFALLNNSDIFTDDFVNEQFKKGQNRGPEFSILRQVSMKAVFGFHRLAINGLNSESNQPIVIDNVSLVCNGEIYNYKELYELMKIPTNQIVTESDCEVIIHLYIRYGIEQTLKMLDGVFAFVLCDSRFQGDSIDNHIFVARDPFGVRPLYSLKRVENQSSKIDNHSPKSPGTSTSFNIFNALTPRHTNYGTKDDKILYDANIIGFASELKSLSMFTEGKYEDTYLVEQFIPGTYSKYTLGNQSITNWLPCEGEINKAYFVPSPPKFLYDSDEQEIYRNKLNPYLGKNYNKVYHIKIRELLTKAVNKRCVTTERPIACLLSGGLDSSLIAALVNEWYKKNMTNGKDNRIETYSIGLSGSEDLRNARTVAKHLNAKHTEIIVTEEEMLESIPEVIRAIESYDTTTVRASIGNYLLGKYIRASSDAKVIFNGDGSDELFGGYLYMKKCPDVIEFDCETRRLLKDIYLFDVLRSDKSISSHGLEPRTPFLDRELVNYYLSLPMELRMPPKIEDIETHYLEREQVIEKNLLRQSFSGSGLLPDSILWRKKEAFSDGVSGTSKPFYQVIQEHVSNKMGDNKGTFLNLEKDYYKQIFYSTYTNPHFRIPYYWMPKYTDAKDPSARTLEVYNEK
jgi:asparagine synthase (glutamine-hydrolysing)